MPSMTKEEIRDWEKEHPIRSMLVGKEAEENENQDQETLGEEYDD